MTEENPWSSVPVRGWRQWRIHDTTLTGISHREPWHPGVNECICKVTPGQVFSNMIWDWTHNQWMLGKDPGHDFESCTCGFYARFYHDAYTERYDSHISGMIEGWGDVVLGPEGFRASKAKVVALVIPRKEKWLWTIEAEPQRSIRRAYDVPIFDTSEEMLAAFPIEQGEFAVERALPPDLHIELSTSEGQGAEVTLGLLRDMYGGKPIEVNVDGWGVYTVTVCPNCVALTELMRGCTVCGGRGWVND